MSTKVDIQLDQRTDLNMVVFKAKDQRGAVIDLTGVEGEATFKTSYNSASKFVLPVTCNANGEVIMTGNTMQTNVAAGYYVFDILLNNGNRIVSGLATVKPAVT